MFNPNQNAAPRRSNADYLRRMTVGEGCCREEGSIPMFRREPAPQPSCEPSVSLGMPSLAMVYAPRQEWTCLIEPPSKALSEGTLFSELVKPFEGSCKSRYQR